MEIEMTFIPESLILTTTLLLLYSMNFAFCFEVLGANFIDFTA